MWMSWCGTPAWARTSRETLRVYPHSIIRDLDRQGARGDRRGGDRGQEAGRRRVEILCLSTASLNRPLLVTVDGEIAPSTSASARRVRACHARGSSVVRPWSLAPFQWFAPPVGLVIWGRSMYQSL